MRQISQTQKRFYAMMAVVLTMSSVLYAVFTARASGAPAWAANGVIVAPSTATNRFSGEQSLWTSSNNSQPITTTSDGSSVFAWVDQDAAKIYAQKVNASGIAQWGTSGAEVYTLSGGSYSGYAVAVVPDASGGAIVVIEDRADYNHYKLYAQKINSAGVIQWGADGADIATSGSVHQLESSSIPDGSGGIITAFGRGSYPEFNIHIQRLNSSGVQQWGASGTQLSTAAGTEDSARIVSDGAGGAIVGWRDGYDSGTTDIFARRVNSSGVAQWTAGGVAVVTDSDQQQYMEMAAYPGGGAVFTWIDERSGAAGVYAQRLNNSGAAQWTANGVQAVATPYLGALPAIAMSGTDSMIMYAYDNGGDQDVNLQKLNSSGATQFGAAGIALTALSGYELPGYLIASGDGGADVLAVFRDGNGIARGQRVTSSGTEAWTSGGVDIGSTNGSFGGFGGITTNSSGDLITALNISQSSGNDIVGQRARNSDGATQWNGSAGLILPDGPGGSANESGALLAADDAGNYVTVWSDYRANSSNADVYAQMFDSTGASQWAAGGVAIATGADDQRPIAIVSDGLGGVLIVWNDSTTTDAYVQRIDSDGSAHPGWPGSGKAIASSGIASAYNAVSDGAAGMIVLYRTNADYTFWANRVTSAAATPWGADGVQASDPTDVLSPDSNSMSADGSGGAYIGWRAVVDFGDYELRLQRLNASGSPVAGWGTYGDVVTAEDAVARAEVATVTGGVVMAWDEFPGYTNGNVKAQKLNGSAAAQWTAGGVTVATTADTQQEPHLTAAGAGAIIVYKDFHFSYQDLYAQRLDGAGARQWGNDGVAVTNSVVNDSGESTYIDTDGSNGAVIAWSDYGNGYPSDVYAQHVDSSGDVQWGTEGVGVAVRAGKTDQATGAVSNGASGIVVVFPTQEDGGASQIRAQMIDDAASAAAGVHLFAPNGYETLTGAGTTDITWAKSGTINHFRIKLSTDSGSTYPTTLVSSTSALSYTWTIPPINTATARIKVEALDSGNFVLASDASANDFTIDMSSNQYGFRWRNDDGSQTTATYAAAENTTPTDIPKETTERLRFGVSGPIGTGTSDSLTGAAQIAGSGPFQIAVTPDGSYTYVSNYFSNAGVWAISNSNLNLVTQINDYGNVQGIAITPDGAHAYVAMANETFVGVIDTATNEYVDTVEMGGASYGVAVSPDGDYVYVTDVANGLIKVIATSTNTVVDTIDPTDSYVSDIAMSPDGAHVYVTNPADGTVIVIRTSNNSEVTTVALGGDPLHLVVTPDSKHVYVTNYDNDEIEVIQTSNNTVSDTIPETDPSSIAISPDGRRVYVTSQQLYTRGIDTSTNTDTGFITIQSFSSGIAVAPDGKHVYIGAVQLGFLPRMLVLTTAGASLDLEYGLKVSTCAAISSWSQVGPVGGSEEWTMSPSANLRNGEPTTNSAGLTDGPGTFTPGYAMDTLSETPRLSFDTDEFTELEFSVEANASTPDGAPYCFRVVADDASVTTYGNYSETELGGSGGSGGSVTAPSAITTLSATGGTSRATLTWTAPSNGGAAITAYAVHYSNDAFVTDDQTCATTSCTDATPGATVLGLTPGTLYSFRVYTVNAIGASSASNVATATPTAPASGTGTTGPTTGTTLANIEDAAPEIASVVISAEATPGTLTSDTDYSTPSSIIGTQGALTPNAGSALTSYVHIIARDGNGWQDIDPDSAGPGSIAYTGYLKHSAVGSCLTANDYDCYTPFSFSNCTLIAHATYTAQIRCAVSLSYYTRSGTWDLVSAVTDRGAASTQFAGPFTVSPILAYRIDTATVDFGTAAVPFSGINNANREVVFTNIGNTGVAELQVDHTAMTCLVGASTSGGSIPASDLAYSTAAISSLTDSYTTGLSTGIPFTFPLPSQTDATLNNKSLFNHLVGVPSGTAGTCSGTIRLTPSS